MNPAYAAAIKRYEKTDKIGLKECSCAGIRIRAQQLARLVYLRAEEATPSMSLLYLPTI